MTEPKWLSDATTIADLLALPEAEQEWWKASVGEDQGWVEWSIWQAWSGERVVRARRKQTVIIDADLARNYYVNCTPIRDTPADALHAELGHALAALDGDA